MTIPPDLELVSGPIDNARHHSARTKARKAALDVLFEADLRSTSIDDALVSLQSATVEPPRLLTTQIVRGVEEHLADLDGRIAEALDPGWTLERMPRIDRALARMAAWELTYSDAPRDAVIAEAVGLAGEYSTEESAGFLNGVLRHLQLTTNL